MAETGEYSGLRFGEEKTGVGNKAMGAMK